MITPFYMCLIRMAPHDVRYVNGPLDYYRFMEIDKPVPSVDGNFSDVMSYY